VFEIDEALDSPFVQQAGMISAVPHPRRPDFRALANPLKIDGERLAQRASPALGADNARILGEEPDVSTAAGGGAA
jgi:crotonobetainyl-CoA:carnitine CoA-transferase CaiB-like acyl-CoA transferase